MQTANANLQQSEPLLCRSCEGAGILSLMFVPFRAVILKTAETAPGVHLRLSTIIAGLRYCELIMRVVERNACCVRLLLAAGARK